MRLFNFDITMKLTKFCELLSRRTGFIELPLSRLKSWVLCNWRLPMTLYKQHGLKNYLAQNKKSKYYYLKAKELF